jgi:hypothetical protein
MGTGAIHEFSSNKLNGAMKGIVSLTQSDAYYNEETFRYLLERESKRSERSGHFYRILLVYHTNAQGVIVRMDSDVAKTVIAALSRCLRDTDYIGWYREGRVVGAVLTVLERDSVADVFNRLRPRLVEILRTELCLWDSSGLRIRLCQFPELEGAEFNA